MSGGHMLPVSHCETQKVNGIVFQVFNSDLAMKHSVVEVLEPVGLVGGQPVPNGLSDLRLGSTDRRFTCKTCNMSHPDCPGHFGHITLAEPFFNIGLYDVTVLALRCVCRHCGMLLADRRHPDWEATMKLTGRARLSAVAKMSNKGKCGDLRQMANDADGEGEAMVAGRGCGREQPKIRRPGGNYPKLVIEVTENNQPTMWNGGDVFRVLDLISDADALAMGFDPKLCHPRDLLVRVLPVPPPAVRPSVSFGVQTSENELTHKLESIIKANTRMRREMQDGVGNETLETVRELLQEHIGTYVSNKSTFYKPAGSGKVPFKAISERLKGKYGRIRGNLMGKRVDFSARTVITGDPNIDVDEVGVPYSVAMTLTFPERVNAVNKKRLQEMVRRTTYPSANYIIHKNGVERALDRLKADARSKLTLDIGDVVERHVLNGDVVLFNRQPTLHRMSMMGHRARVLPFSTFRLNLSCTTPYNADFDGDEMNLHVAQSLLTKAELIEMMMVPKNFVSPGKSQPCMGIVQDSLLGCYRVTNKDTFIDKFFMQNIVMWLDRWELPVPAIVKPHPLWTGKQVFSMLLPEVTHMTHYKPDDHNDKFFFPHDDGALLIRRGELLMGPIKKTVVGAAPGSLIHVIANEKGSDEVAKFINFVQRTTAYFLYQMSFSVGVADTIADPDTLNEIRKILRKTTEDVRRIAAKANNAELKRKTGMTLLASFEADMNSALNDCRSSAAKTALSNVKSTNNFRQMIEAGSKGSDLNICQIAVMVGQQNVAGKRIPFHFRRRTLPHFVQDDYGETSRGMVRNGYLDGLTPPEFVFHTMGGREGLIDTAVKTADTGYLQRKLVKALEDNFVNYDGTVRNANGHLLQLMYGEDGLEGSKIEQNQAFNLPLLDDNTMRKKFRFEYGEDGSYSDAVGGDYMPEGTKRLLRANPDCYRALQEEYEQVMRDRQDARDFLDVGNMETTKLLICLPVNLERLVVNTQMNFNLLGRAGHQSDLNPVFVVEKVQELQNDIKKFFASQNRGPTGAIDNHLCAQRIESALRLFFVHLRSTLASKRVIKEFKLNKTAFEYLLGEIRLKYHQSLVPAGEMIGPIAAQSCGEPATQMTLNTFHNAGISSKNVTLGVPRLVELLGVSRNQKHSSMLIELVEELQERKKCEAAVHEVEYATLETITRRFEMLYDRDPPNTIVDEDRDFVAVEWDEEMLEDHELEERQRRINSMSPWVVRLELDREMLQDKGLSMEVIRTRAEAATMSVDETGIARQLFFYECPRKQGVKPVLRMRLLTNDQPNEVEYLKEYIPKFLSRVHLGGIPGVKKVLSTEVKYCAVGEDGGMSEQKKWCLDTEGTALRRVWGDVRDVRTGESIVNFTRTSSNNIPEVYRTLGIEAARIKFFLEMRLAYNNYGVFINYRHYSVLIDTMCHRGYLMAVSRTGINRTDVGPMMSASFEETVKILMEAAAFGVKDSCKGVSASLMLGNQVGVGTGVFDLILDTAALTNAVAQSTAVEADSKQVNVYHGASSVLQHSARIEGRTPYNMASRIVGSSVFGAEAAGVPTPMAPGSVAPSTTAQGSRAAGAFSAFQPSEFAPGGLTSAGMGSARAAGAGSAWAPASSVASSEGGSAPATGAFDAAAAGASAFNLETPGLPASSDAAGAFASPFAPFSADLGFGASPGYGADAFQVPSAAPLPGTAGAAPSSHGEASSFAATATASSAMTPDPTTFMPGDDVETMNQQYEDRV